MRRIDFIRNLIVLAGAFVKMAHAQAADGTTENGPTAVEMTPLNIDADTYYASGITDDLGSYATSQTSATTRLPLSIRENPQSFTVVARQQLNDQNLNSIKDVLENTTEVSPLVLDYRSSYYARGLKIDSFQFDCITSTSTNGTDYLDTAFYDRVEVVKGAPGLLTGTGNPSTSISLVRKRPTSDFKGEGSLSAGSWDNYRGTVDLSRPLSEDPKIRSRIVAVELDNRSFIDGYYATWHALGWLTDPRLRWKTDEVVRSRARQRRLLDRHAMHNRPRGRKNPLTLWCHTPAQKQQ